MRVVPSELATSGIGPIVGPVATTPEQRRAAAVTLADLALTGDHTGEDLRTALAALDLLETPDA